MHDTQKIHNMYIVKHNDGKTIRLALFVDIVSNVAQQARLEVELTPLPEEAKNPNWQTHCIIWWSPTSHFWYEATRDDSRAEQEYQLVLTRLKDFPDINPEDSNSCGTLLKSEGTQAFFVTDGNARNLH